MCELSSHNSVIADAPQEDSFVHDHGKTESGFTGQSFLAKAPDPQEAVMDTGRDIRCYRLEGGIKLPRVIRRLQQAGDDIGLPLGAGCCLGFESDEFQILRVNGIGIVIPPAAAGGFLGKL